MSKANWSVFFHKPAAVPAAWKANGNTISGSDNTLIGGERITVRTVKGGSGNGRSTKNVSGMAGRTLYMVAFFRFSLEGQWAIEDVELGDYVLARDEDTDEFAWKPIFQP